MYEEEGYALLTNAITYQLTTLAKYPVGNKILVSEHYIDDCYAFDQFSIGDGLYEYMGNTIIPVEKEDIIRLWEKDKED